MPKSRPSLEERQIFCVWFYENYHRVLSMKEAEILLTGKTFKRVNKWAWRENGTQKGKEQEE